MGNCADCCTAAMEADDLIAARMLETLTPISVDFGRINITLEEATLVDGTHDQVKLSLTRFTLIDVQLKGSASLDVPVLGEMKRTVVVICDLHKTLQDMDAGVDVKRWMFEGGEEHQDDEGDGVSLSDMAGKAEALLEAVGYSYEDVLDKIRAPVTKQLQEKINAKIREKTVLMDIVDVKVDAEAES